MTMNATAQILITQRYVVAATVSRTNVPRKKSSLPAQLIVQEVEGVVSIGPDSKWTNLVQAIVDAVEQLECAQHAVSLIIPSSWCYLASLDKPSKRFDPEAMSFEMEEALPVPLESLTTNFAIHKRNVIGVAVETKALKALIMALGECRLGVANVWVDVLVASAMARSRGSSNATLIDVDRSATINFVTENESRTYVRNRIGGVPDDQRGLTPNVDGDPAAEHAVLFDLRTPPLPNGDAKADSDSIGIGARELVTANVDVFDIPDLRTGPLAHKDRFADMYRRVSGVAILGIVLCCVLWGKGYRQQQSLQRQVVALRQEQAEVYKEVFPEGTVPRNAATRLASERKDIEALATTDAVGPILTAANRPMDDLNAFVKALPANVRILATEVLINAKQFSLRGHTASHRDAERIADAIALIKGMEVGSLRTSRLKNGGVKFSLKGRRKHASP